MLQSTCLCGTNSVSFEGDIIVRVLYWLLTACIYFKLSQYLDAMSLHWLPQVFRFYKYQQHTPSTCWVQGSSGNAEDLCQSSRDWQYYDKLFLRRLRINSISQIKLQRFGGRGDDWRSWRIANHREWQSRCWAFCKKSAQLDETNPGSTTGAQCLASETLANSYKYRTESLCTLSILCKQNTSACSGYQNIGLCIVSMTFY